MQTKTFSLQRLGLLLRRDLLNGSRIGWIVAGVIFVIFFLIVYYNIGDTVSDYRSDGGFAYSMLKILFYTFTPALLISGFILSSIVYLELGKFSTKQAYLTIPATTFEKWLSKWVISAILFPIAFVLLYQVFAQVCYWATARLGVELVRVSLFDPLIWKFVGLYILLQSLFLLGSVSMPNYSLFKSLAIVLLLLFVAFLVLNLTVRLGNSAIANNGESFFSLNFLGFNPNDELEYFLENTLAELAKNVGIYVVFPIVLFISFLKLKEKEV